MPEPEHEPPEPSGPSPYEGPSVVPPPSSEVRPGSPALRDPERGRARPGWRDRFRRRRAPKPERPATKETRPARGNRRRVSAVDDFTDVAMWAGDFFGQRTPYRATGHAIALNASTTGFMLDDAVKGTLVDRGLVQPAVRNRERVEAVLVCFEIPFIVNMIERELLREGQTQDGAREAMDRWAPRLRRAVQRALPLMVPAIKKVRAREAELQAAAAEIYGEDIGGAQDPIEAIMRELLSPLFAGPGPEQPAPPQPAPAPEPQGAGPDG